MYFLNIFLLCFCFYRGEQNFHIFYYIHDGLLASDRAQEFHLKPNTVYR